MARPKKATVDYFSHDVNHGKTIAILEERFGNDGYAFWFKLLESLGRTEGHFLDCSDPVEWAFLVSRCRVTKERAEEIMSTLVELRAIDSGAWEKRQIWCQKFVDRMRNVYAKRECEAPKLPVSVNGNPVAPELPSTENLFPIEETDIVKKSKGKETKEEQEAQQAARFDVFWNRYGYKKSKLDAERAWKKITMDSALYERILRAIDDQEKERNARKAKTGRDEPRPYPATWLNGERWNDEIIMPEQPKRYELPNLADIMP